MLKYTALISAVVILALAVPGTPSAPSGSWQVDPRFSNAQISADGTTGFGKTKSTFTIGYGRVNGTVKLDGDNPANSAFDFRFYPATSMDPPIGEDGKVKIDWFSNHANNTLVCFHSKGVEQTPDGHLKTTGKMTLTRVDRNVELSGNEGYSGPVYGPPMIHQVTRDITFIFSAPAPGATGSKAGTLSATGSTSMAREDFPQLVKAVIATYWPPVVQDRKCTTSAPNEGYSGTQCTGTFLLPSMPTPPGIGGREDYPGPQGFNSVSGDHLSIAVRMQLTASAGAKAAGGN